MNENDKIARFHRHADRLEKAARSVRDPDLRLLYVRLAQQWRELAADVEMLEQD